MKRAYMCASLTDRQLTTTTQNTNNNTNNRSPITTDHSIIDERWPKNLVGTTDNNAQHNTSMAITEQNTLLQEHCRKHALPFSSNTPTACPPI